MAESELPAPELLRKLLIYCPETGDFIWRARTPDMFVCTKQSPETLCASWNTRFAGKRAGRLNQHGYREIGIAQKLWQAHRIAWAMNHDEWPAEEIDHIDHDRSNNRLRNLRLVSRQENRRNQSKARKNSSGFNGVSYSKRAKAWRAYVTFETRQIHLGFFPTKDLAIAARKAANATYGFHSNHGN